MTTTFLETFRPGGDPIRILQEIEFNLSFSPESLAQCSKEGELINQGAIFSEDLKRQIKILSAHTKYELLYLAQCVSTIIASPFALFIDMFKMCTKNPINASTVLKNIYVIPREVIISIFCIIMSGLSIANKTISALYNSSGYFAWHFGEKLVGLIRGTTYTVLSDDCRVRDIVYESIGVTLLAGAAVFIPILPIQLIALPIILGSLYGTINNQFTVRTCPEYYTMGHFYDGTNLRGHAVKTNNLLIKPIVTGCYATTMVTRIAGPILAAVGAIPFTAAVLSVQCAAAMIGTVILISLIAAHIFSVATRRNLEKSIQEYVALTGIEWSEQTKNMTWNELVKTGNKILETQQDSNSEQKTLKLKKLASFIEENIAADDLPVKYIAGWQANNIRNSVGYLFAGGGTIVLSISTIFLRIFAL